MLKWCKVAAGGAVAALVLVVALAGLRNKILLSSGGEWLSLLAGGSTATGGAAHGLMLARGEALGAFAGFMGGKRIGS